MLLQLIFPEADNALEYAAALAIKWNARIILFNSFKIPLHVSNSILPADSIIELERKNEELLNEKAADLNARYGVETICESGLMREVHEELSKLFEKYEADLIVMGMASRSLAQDMFGNTTTSAILQLEYPVLAVPKEVSFKPLKKLLYAYDRLSTEPEKTLNKIANIAQTLESEIEIFHVHDQNEPLKGEIPDKSVIDARFSSIPHSFKRIDSETVIEEIEHEIKTFGFDLLIMVPQRYGFWESFLHRSKTRMMASGSDIPLLSIPG